MSTVSEAIHNHHQEILDTLTKKVSAITGGETQETPAALVAFLKNDLIPHALGEEAYLYPAVDPLVKNYGKATATMTVDHEFITRYISQIEEATNALKSAPEAEKAPLQETLKRLSLQLEAVLALHLEKEERVYVPLFEKYLPEAEQQRILDGMHEAYNEENEAQAEANYLDVRAIAPRQRHTLIFETFEELNPGQAFVLVNDHDPKPLYYQFQAELAGRFTWDYLEQGPEVWKVKIAQTAGSNN